MTEYCSSTDIENRLTANGYLNVADRDYGGTVSAAELAANITSAIEWAGSEIDYALVNHRPAYNTDTARSSGNVFLRSRAIDLASWQVVSNGGRDVPDSFQAAYDRAVAMLDAIREDGELVPGLAGDSTWNANSNESFEIQSGGIT